jgi:hypothetical protein
MTDGWTSESLAVRVMREEYQRAHRDNGTNLVTDQYNLCLAIAERVEREVRTQAEETVESSNNIDDALRRLRRLHALGEVGGESVYCDTCEATDAQHIHSIPPATTYCLGCETPCDTPYCPKCLATPPAQSRDEDAAILLDEAEALEFQARRAVSTPPFDSYEEHKVADKLNARAKQLRRIADRLEGK